MGIIGETADGGEPATNRFVPGDMLATIYSVLGIDHAEMLPDKQNRPVRLVRIGEPIRELSNARTHAHAIQRLLCWC